MSKTQELLNLICERRDCIITGTRCFRFNAEQMDTLIEGLQKMGGDIEVAKVVVEEQKKKTEEWLNSLETQEDVL